MKDRLWHNNRKPASAELSLKTSSHKSDSLWEQTAETWRGQTAWMFLCDSHVSCDGGNASLLWASNITPAWKQVWNREENLKYDVKITHFCKGFSERLSGELYTEETSCCSGWAHLRLHWSVNASLPEETFGGCRAPRGLICVFTVLSSLTQTQLCLCCIQGASVIRLPWGALLLGNQTQMLKNKRRGTLWEAPCGSQIRRAQAAGHVTMPAHKSDWTLKERWRAGFSNTFIHKHRNRAASKAFQNDVNQTNQ